MSTYITLHKIKVQNANCVAGLTFGFPAISHFLGYTHALSRKLQRDYPIALLGCSVICHQHQIQAYQPSGWGDYFFALTRNPLTKEGKTAAIVEEGRMHMTISLIIECEGVIAGGEAGQNVFKQALLNLAQRHKLSGGTIIAIDNISVDCSDEQTILTRRIMRSVMPGFVLIDRSPLLGEHLTRLQQSDPQADLLEAWLDFSALKYQAQAIVDEYNTDELNETNKAIWQPVAKPAKGHLVPITTGFKAISDVHQPGTVINARDSHTPFCFVEAVYGIGEWQSPQRVQDISHVIWRYHHQAQWYVCKTSQPTSPVIHPDQQPLLIEEDFSY
jgi:CRISPR-associated protein Csy2